MNPLLAGALILAAYVTGSLPIGLLVARSIKGVDIRDHGSGNIGATNVGRIVGRPWGVVVFALDMLKGFVPTLAAGLLHQPPYNPLDRIYDVPLVAVLCGIAAVCGHNFSVFLKFKGGKGVSTSAGVFLYLFPLGTLICLAVWVLTVAATRTISVASMTAGVALSACALILPPDPFGASKFLTAVCLVVTALVIIRHKSNIKRLLAGTESKLGERQDIDESEQPDRSAPTG